MIKSANILNQQSLFVQKIEQHIHPEKINVQEFVRNTGNNFDRRKVSDVIKCKAFDIDILDNLAAYYLNASINFQLVNFEIK